MVQIAIRALTLCIYNGNVLHHSLLLFFLQLKEILYICEVKYIFGLLQQYPFGYAVSDDMVYQYITTPPTSKYFSNLVLSLKEQCFHLDTLVHAAMYELFTFLENLFQVFESRNSLPLI